MPGFHLPSVASVPFRAQLLLLFTSFLLLAFGSTSSLAHVAGDGAKTPSATAAFLRRFMPDLEVLRPLATGAGVSDKCFTTLAIDLEVLDVDCLKDVIATGLSYAIILFSSVLKVPLIRNIRASESVQGLSTVSTYLETTIYSGNFIYNLLIEAPLKTYAETATLTLQNAVIILCIWQYNKASVAHMVATVAGFCALMTAFYHLPEEMRSYIVVYTVACTVISRLPQIAANFHNGHTGVLSLASTVMSVAGGSVRIMTVLREVNDLNAVIPIITGVSLQAVILSQILLYRAETKRVMEQSERKKKD